jgi:hypothetical protein
MGLKIENEDEKIISDILEIYSETLKTYNKSGTENDIKREKILKQVSYRAVVQGGILINSTDLSKLENYSESDRMKYVLKKSNQMMLLSLDSGRISVYSCKLKDQISLSSSDCEVIMNNNKSGLSENNKFMFTLVYNEKGVLT